MVIWRLFSLSAIFLFVGVLDAKKQLDPVDEYCQTELHRHARSEFGYKHIQRLLRADYDPNQEDILGNTPLSEACDAGILMNVICLIHYDASFEGINVSAIKSVRIREFFTTLLNQIAQRVLREDAVEEAVKKVVSLRYSKGVKEEGAEASDEGDQGDDSARDVIFFERPATPQGDRKRSLL